MNLAKEQNALVLSFLTVRRALGVLGIALPVLLLVYGLFVNGRIEDSISAFYYTGMGDVFVGILCAIGVFLFSYKGYPPEPGEKITDQRVAQIAGVGAVLTALFPTPNDLDAACAPTCLTTGFEDSFVHLAAAVVFFAAMAVFCFVLFTRTTPGTGPDQTKQHENTIYRACGTIIVVMIVALLAQFFFVAEGSSLRLRLDDINLVFWLEAVAIIAFGTAWLVKGKTLQALRGITPD